MVKDLPKPMADINGRPFLCYLLDYLSQFSISKILLSVGYKYDLIKNYFGSSYENMSIKYVIEDKPLGTGGAIKKALAFVEADECAVLNGDTFFNLDLKQMIDFHQKEDSMLTIAVKPMNDFDRYGTVIIKDRKVVGFNEKSFRRFGYINGGVYVVKKAISGFFKSGEDAFSFEADFLNEKISGIRSFAFISDEYFIDIGIPDDYKKAQKELIFLKE